MRARGEPACSYVCLSGVFHFNGSALLIKVLIAGAFMIGPDEASCFIALRERVGRVGVLCYSCVCAAV